MWKRSRRSYEIAPDEIFLDATNLPGHDPDRMEGRVERPVSMRAIVAVGIFFMCVAFGFGARAYVLQIAQGASYAEVSRNNTLDSQIAFATRGVIYDRIGTELAWNETPVQASDATSTVETFARRHYTAAQGLSHLLGWVRYPRQDSAGEWWRAEYTPMGGIELSFDAQLRGENGSRMTERDARGKVQREDIVALPENGEDLHLSVDAAVTSELYRVLWRHAQAMHFTGGAGVIIDVQTGELLAITSFPEYDNSAFTGGDAAAVAKAYDDARTPMLDRAVSGLYTPGSIVKPLFAAAAFTEGIISPDKVIVSTGAISVPNPYDPKHPTLFRDWTVHGPVDMRTAIAVSSDEYFYTIGGGYGGQAGLGIDRIDQYARLFGLGSTTGIALPGEKDGIIPTPAWKAQVFGPEDPWRIGNTYHTAIGQYGFLVTPVQAAVFTAAIANGGTVLTPQLLASSTPVVRQKAPVPPEALEIAREGMRMAVTSTRRDATVKALNIAGIEIAAKTGTAQLGNKNQWMNSWSVGFWPASHPRYAYAVVLEHAPAGTASGAAPGLVPFFEWLITNKPEYVR